MSRLPKKASPETKEGPVENTLYCFILPVILEVRNEESGEYFTNVVLGKLGRTQGNLIQKRLTTLYGDYAGTVLSRQLLVGAHDMARDHLIFHVTVPVGRDIDKLERTWRKALCIAPNMSTTLAKSMFLHQTTKSPKERTGAYTDFFLTHRKLLDKLQNLWKMYEGRSSAFNKINTWFDHLDGRPRQPLITGRATLRVPVGVSHGQLMLLTYTAKDTIESYSGATSRKRDWCVERHADTGNKVCSLFVYRHLDASF